MKKYLFWFFSLLIIHMLLSLQLKFTAWPEMLTYPWLMQKGYSLYQDIILPYLPLLPILLLACYKLLGFSVISLKIITLFFILINDLLIFLICKNKYGTKKAYIGLIIFIIGNLYFEGNGLWFDFACLPFLLIIYWLLNVNSDYKRSRLILIGFCLGLAVLIKQNSIIFLFPIIFYLRNKLIKIIPIILGLLIPLLFTFIIFTFQTNFSDFLYWGLYHPIFVHSKLPGFVLWPTLKQILIVAIWFFPTIIFFGFSKKYLWLMLAFVFALPRFGYFHLQIAVAFYAILFPEIISKLNNKYIRSLLAGYILVIVLLFGKFVIREWQQPVRFFENDVLWTKNIIQEKIPQNKQVLFLNVSSEFFVMSDVLPIKPWADNFPWYMEVPGMQNKILSNLDTVSYIIFSPYKNYKKFDLGAYKPVLIDNYVKENFIYKENINSSIMLLIRKK